VIGQGGIYQLLAYMTMIMVCSRPFYHFRKQGTELGRNLFTLFVGLMAISISCTRRSRVQLCHSRIVRENMLLIANHKPC